MHNASTHAHNKAHTLVCRLTPVMPGASTHTHTIQGTHPSAAAAEGIIECAASSRNCTLFDCKKDVRIYHIVCMHLIRHNRLFPLCAIGSYGIISVAVGGVAGIRIDLYYTTHCHAGDPIQSNGTQQKQPIVRITSVAVGGVAGISIDYYCTTHCHAGDPIQSNGTQQKQPIVRITSVAVDGVAGISIDYYYTTHCHAGDPLRSHTTEAAYCTLPGYSMATCTRTVYEHDG